MSDNNGYSTSAVILSFLIGGIVGAGATLLMAPESGEGVRRRIREYADDTRSRASDYLDQTRGKVTTQIEKGREIYEEKKSAISSAIEAGKEAFLKEQEKQEEESS